MDMKKIRQDILLFLILFLLVPFSMLGLNGCAKSSNSLSRVEKAPEGEVVEAEGMAPITADLLATKKASLADAQRVAVEKVVGVFVSGKTLIEKAVAIEQNILAKSAGYIKKYEVIKEWQEGGYYYTRIKAFVSYQKIWIDLDNLALLRSPVVGNPRIAIFINEATLSNILAQSLIRHGYKVVTRHEAEITINGDVSATPITTPELSGLISIRGILSARALKPKTGEILTAVSTQASGVDITEEAAYQKTMAILGEKAAKDFSESLASLLASRPSISLTVRGITSFDKLLKLREALKKIEGINDLFVRSYSEGFAEIEINTITVTSVDIAKVLSKKGWQVVSQTHDTLEVNSK